MDMTASTLDLRSLESDSIRKSTKARKPENLLLWLLMGFVSTAWHFLIITSLNQEGSHSFPYLTLSAVAVVAVGFLAPCHFRGYPDLRSDERLWFARLWLRLAGCLGVALLGVLALSMVNATAGAGWPIYLGMIPGATLMAVVIWGDIKRTLDSRKQKETWK